MRYLPGKKERSAERIGAFLVRRVRILRRSLLPWKLYREMLADARRRCLSLGLFLKRARITHTPGRASGSEEIEPAIESEINEVNELESSGEQKRP